MKDFDRLIARFQQFGGWRLLWQYAHMGVLWIGVKECIRCVVNGRSFKSIYPIITKDIDHSLIERYKTSDTLPMEIMSDAEPRNTIWFCWLQGMDEAPELVHACYNSLRSNLSSIDITVITKDNYSEYVCLPEYIEQKYRKGIIPAPLFSDILRLCLLLRYGGTWIDASVLCTSNKYWEDIQKSDLFLFRYFRNGKAEGVSNWFIHASPGCPLLRKVFCMTLDYWRDYNCVVEYYIFHVFFSYAARLFPEYIKQMPRGNSYANIRLGNYLHADFNQAVWDKLTTEVSFHKLNYRNTSRAANNLNSFYNYILKRYSSTIK